MIEAIAEGVGIALGLAIVFGITMLGLMLHDAYRHWQYQKRSRERYTLCPHGWSWDECPVCGH